MCITTCISMLYVDFWVYMQVPFEVKGHFKGQRSFQGSKVTSCATCFQVLSYSDVARGVPSDAKQPAEEPAPAQQEEEVSESHHLEVPHQRSYSEVVQRGPVVVVPPCLGDSHAPAATAPPQQLSSHPETVQPQACPATTAQSPQPPSRPETVQQQLCTAATAPLQQPLQLSPRVAVPVPLHGRPMVLIPHPQLCLAQPIPPAMIPCCPPPQQCCPNPMQPGQQPYCTPTVQQQCHPRMVAISPPVMVPGFPGAVHLQPHPLRLQQKRYPTEDFETLLARRKEEYARIRAEKERFEKVLEEIRKMVSENETFIAQHSEQAAKLTFRKK